MILVDLDFTTRKDGFHRFRNYKIEAARVGSGVGVLVSFELSQIDRDFREALHSREVGLWRPSQDELDRIQWFLDESDYKTAKLLKVKGWTTGPRPFQLHDFM